MSDFDPYHRWLGIAPNEQPADHYRLLGLQQFESDADVIESAADRQMSHVRSHQTGKHADDAQRLLNEIAAAKLVLLKSDERKAYDAQLRAKSSPPPKVCESKIRQTLSLESSMSPSPLSQIPSMSLASSPEPVIQKNTTMRSGRPNVLLLAGAGAAVAVVLILGAAAAFVFKAWDTNTNTNVAQHSDPVKPPSIVVARAVTPTNNGSSAAQISDADASRSLGQEPEQPGLEGQAANTSDTPTVILPVREAHDLSDEELIAQAPNVVPQASAGPKKTPVPGKAERDAARAKIDAIFPLAASNTPEKKATLALQLLAVARDTKSDPVAQFVLLNMARELAAENGQARLAMQAVDLLGANFDFDASSVRMATLGAAVKSPLAPTEKKEVLAVGIEMIDVMMQRDEYEAAGTLAVALLDIARRARDRELLDALVDRRTRAADLLTSYKTAQAAIETLKTDPDSADANLTAGKFYLFAKADWDRALPLLAKGSDEQHALAAKAEMQKPSTTEQEEKLANAWFTLAEAQTDKAAQQMLQSRAMAWYSRAVPKLSGLSKAAAQQKLKQLTDAGVRPADLAADLGIFSRDPAPASDPATDADMVYLDDLREIESQTYKELGKHGRVGYGDEAGNTFKGTKPTHALSMAPLSKSSSHVTYRIEGKYKWFQAVAGQWDSKDNAPYSNCPLVFHVVGDGKTLWTSNRLQKHGVGETCNVNVEGVRELTLRVDCPDMNWNARAVWIAPQLSVNKIEEGEPRPRPTPEDGLLAHWTFDDGQGEVARDSAGGHHGTIKGATWIKGVHGGALSFDGQNDLVLIGNPDALDFEGDISLAAWVRVKEFPAAGGVAHILTHGYMLRPDAGVDLSIMSNKSRDKVRFRCESWTGTSANAVTLATEDDMGQWLHLAGTYDGRQWQLYRNGKLADRLETTQGAVRVRNRIAWIHRASSTATSTKSAFMTVRCRPKKSPRWQRGREARGNAEALLAMKEMGLKINFN